ncbi:hypothetical protein CHARACLAT_021598 [Characodon lateralis]|uniref:Ring finger protein 38 n=1 Tax=Characodon lateralis TaxID=208331 RepID=A0ABU7CU78_9TELE|nr:hypothetical protein [Characodon lateralis]
MDPPRTRSRSRSGFYHFSMNGSVGGNEGGLMNASGGGVSYPPPSNPGWAPHHGGRGYPEGQQQQPLPPPPQHAQGSYLSAGVQRHSGHGAHRHPGAGVLHFHPDNLCSEDRDKMEDSPSPKRQRLSQQSMLDHGSAPPSTPSSPIRPWELPPSRRPHPHYMPERCHTPVRNRRSPPMRRQRGRRDRLTRHHHHHYNGNNNHHHHHHPNSHHHHHLHSHHGPSPGHQDENYRHPAPPQGYPPYSQQPPRGPGSVSEDRPGYHPPNPSPRPLHQSPNLSPRLLHPGAHPGHPHPHPSQQQSSGVLDLQEQGSVPVSYPVSPPGVPPGLPPRSAPQQIPACSVVFSGQHYPVCSVPPSVLQTCSVQHLPMPYPFPSLLSTDPTFLIPPPHLTHPPTHLSHHPPHLPQPAQFGPYPTQQARSAAQYGTSFVSTDPLSYGLKPRFQPSM